MANKQSSNSTAMTESSARLASPLSARIREAVVICLGALALFLLLALATYHHQDPSLSEGFFFVQALNHLQLMVLLFPILHKKHNQ